MVARTVRLVDPTTSREFLLHQAEWPRSDVVLINVDVPSPQVRAVTANRADADGVWDTTASHGSRAVSIEVALLDRPMELAEEINAFLHPSARPYLVIDDDEWDVPRQLRLRVDQFSSPMPRESHLFRQHQVQWQAPDGVWEATEPMKFTVSAGADEAVGRTYSEVWPRRYPAAPPPGRIEIVNPGNTWAHQTVRLYGPAIGPRYSDDNTGHTIAFTDALELQAGEYVEIDTRNRTAFAMSEPDASRLHLLDFQASAWWRLAPGRNSLRYHPIAGVDIGAAADGEFTPAWL